MTQSREKIRVAVNGYGVIGKRVADAVAAQDDMEVAGIADVEADWRMHVALKKGYELFASRDDRLDAMRAKGLEVAGTLGDLLGKTDVVVDCTPKGIPAQNAERYRAHGVKFIVQGGEQHDLTGHSFVAEATNAEAIDRDATRVVSCNTTSVVRTLTALKRAGLPRRARGTLLRRATDPWESDKGGIMNTLVPEQEIPSHQGPDARTVDPQLDVLTTAVKVPENTAHMHYWSVELTREAGTEEIIDALRDSSRITPIRNRSGLDGHQHRQGDGGGTRPTAC